MNLRRIIVAIALPALGLGLLPVRPAAAAAGVTLSVYVEGSYTTSLRVCATARPAAGSGNYLLALTVEGAGTNGATTQPYVDAPVSALPSTGPLCSAWFPTKGSTDGVVHFGATASAGNLTGTAAARCDGAYAWAITGLTSNPLLNVTC